ncbi:MAG: hypothetical protein ABR955_03995 [Verrucomicrobiota bacterium]|jgi:hypothetical protein
MGLAATVSVFAQQQPFMQGGTAQPALLSAPIEVFTPAGNSSGTNAPAAPAPNPVETFFNGDIHALLANGKVNLNVRLRYEQADEEGVNAITKDSYAPTIRTRFGYTTAPLYGFQGMLEAVNVSVLGPEHNYNAAGSNGHCNSKNVGKLVVSNRTVKDKDGNQKILTRRVWNCKDCKKQFTVISKKSKLILRKRHA